MTATSLARHGHRAQACRSLGVQLDPTTVVNQREAYCSNAAAWVWEALTTMDGRAPVHCVLIALDDMGCFVPEEVLFDAITDEAGGFSFYPLP